MTSQPAIRTPHQFSKGQLLDGVIDVVQLALTGGGFGEFGNTESWDEVTCITKILMQKPGTDGSKELSPSAQMS